MAAHAAAVAVFAHTSAAEAQLHDEAERVAQSWRSSGASVVVAQPRFLDKKETSLSLPAVPTAACTTLALLGVRGLGFRVRMEQGGEGSPERLGSEAGVVSIERCGMSPLERAVIVSESGRGALEIVVGSSSGPLPPVRSILSDRTEGHAGTPPEPGPPPSLAPAEKRARAHEARALRDGSEIGPRLRWMAGPEGRGSVEIALDAGCHTFVLFAAESSGPRSRRGGKLDVDAEMRDASDDHVLSRDQTDAPDAQVAACVGEETRVRVAFVGARSESPVLVAHIFHRLPDHLPTLWGSEVRARMAQALLARHAPSPSRDADVLAQGSAGSVSLPLSLEPGGCYLAVAALAERGAHGLGLTVRVDGREAGDARGVDDAGAVVAFCAGAQRQAQAQLEARTILGWNLAVFRLENGVWEPPW
jgi:hypothetical protein